MKSLVVLLCLATVALADITDITPCDSANRDCTCGDRSYKTCNEPGAQVSLHVNDLGECILNCDLFATMGQCDWFIFYNHGPDENCRLIAQGESMEEYLNSCNMVGQPIHYKNGNCMSKNITHPFCKMENVCPGKACDWCDPTENCEKNYHETECTLTNPAVLTVELDENTYETCALQGILQSQSNPLTYLTWDKQAEKCEGFSSGARNCDIQVVKAGFSIGDVEHCKTG